MVAKRKGQGRNAGGRPGDLAAAPNGERDPSRPKPRYCVVCGTQASADPARARAVSEDGRVPRCGSSSRTGNPVPAWRCVIVMRSGEGPAREAGRTSRAAARGGDSGGLFMGVRRSNPEGVRPFAKRKEENRASSFGSRGLFRGSTRGGGRSPGSQARACSESSTRAKIARRPASRPADDWPSEVGGSSAAFRPGYPRGADTAFFGCATARRSGIYRRMGAEEDSNEHSHPAIWPISTHRRLVSQRWGGERSERAD